MNDNLQLRVAGLVWGSGGVGDSLYVFRYTEGGGEWRLPAVAVPQEQSMKDALIVFLEGCGLSRIGQGNLTFVEDIPVKPLGIRYAYLSGWRYARPDLPNFVKNDVLLERRLMRVENLLAGGAHELREHDQKAINHAMRMVGM